MFLILSVKFSKIIYNYLVFNELTFKLNRKVFPKNKF